MKVEGLKGDEPKFGSNRTSTLRKMLGQKNVFSAIFTKAIFLKVEGLKGDEPIFGSNRKSTLRKFLGQKYFFLHLCVISKVTFRKVDKSLSSNEH